MEAICSHTLAARRGGGQETALCLRTLLHMSGIFPSCDSGAVIMYSGTRLVHYSAFTPRYFRFPFLTARDVQVGDTWTEPSYRGRGLAKRSLRQLVILLSEPGRSIWYVVEDTNRASVKVAEDCGFHLAGVGNAYQAPERVRSLRNHRERAGGNCGAHHPLTTAWYGAEKAVLGAYAGVGVPHLG